MKVRERDERHQTTMSLGKRGKGLIYGNGCEDGQPQWMVKEGGDRTVERRQIWAETMLQGPVQMEELC